MTASSEPVTSSAARRWWGELTGPDSRFVLVHFLLSRAIFLAGGALTAMLVEAGTYAQLVPLATSSEVLDNVRTLLVNGDSGWYWTIVSSGYESIPFSAEEQHNWAFFPLFPILVRLVGGTIEGGVLAANIAAFAAVWILVREVREVASGSAARWTALFVLYWPMSGMLSTYRPESLLLLFAVLTWVFARRGHWWLAWIAVALATMARSQGFLVVLLMIDPIWAQRDQLRRHPWPLILGAAFPLLALGAFSLHLWDLTGDPLAWSHIQAAWNRTAIDPTQLVENYWPLLFVGSEGWDFAFFNLLVVGLVVGASLLMLRARRPGFAVFSLAWMALPVLFGATLMALGRYATTLFPVAMTLASTRALRRYRLMILLVMAGLLFGVGSWLSLGLRPLMP